MRIYLDNCCFNRPYDDNGILTRKNLIKEIRLMNPIHFFEERLDEN